MFSKKATKIDEIFTVDLTLCSKCQIDGEDFINFCGLLREHEHYLELRKKDDVYKWEELIILVHEKIKYLNSKYLLFILSLFQSQIEWHCRFIFLVCRNEQRLG